MEGKRNITDFALWKFSPNPAKVRRKTADGMGKSLGSWISWLAYRVRAMSMKALGDTFDIHTGGIDHINIHHTNEIAQSEAATGKEPVKYWVHYDFLLVDGEKMSKSLRNIYTVEDVQRKGFDPLALRYLFLTAYYRESLNFTWKSLEAAQSALEKLRTQVAVLRKQERRSAISEEKSQKVSGFRDKFLSLVNEDMNTSAALAVMWEMLKSNIPSEDKYDLAITFDEVLGLRLGEYSAPVFRIPEEVKKLASEREKLRKEEKFLQADKVRVKIENKGFLIEDSPSGPQITPKR